MGVGEEEVELRAGDFLVFPPGQDHVLLAASADLDLFVFALQPDLAERTLGHLVPRANRGCLTTHRERERWENCLHALATVHQAEAVEESLVQLFQSAHNTVQKGHVTGRRALHEMIRRPDLSARALAELLGTGQSELSRVFRRQWGVPLVQLRARIRLIRFINAVDQGAALTRAATEADFGSYAQCHRIFRSILGCSPSDYFGGARQMLNDAVLESPPLNGVA